MPLYIKNFKGRMDGDNDHYRVNEINHIDALNITRDSQLSGLDEVVSNILGNRLVDYTLPSGDNKVIGTKEDLIRNRIYSFVWNSNGYHTIKYFDNVLGTEVHLLTSKTDCYLGKDILAFNPSYKINHIDIIYRNEGDLIYWTDGLNSPRCLDVAYIQSFGSNTIRITDIEMAKQPPSIPPFCWYQDDNTVTVNNLRKNVFKFKLRYVYEDLTKSTTSSQGALPLPISENVLTDAPSKNAKVSIALTTGEKNVTKIEILAANNIGNVFSDYYTIKVIDKAELSLADNTVVVFNFYNNEAYNNIDVLESIQLFDYIPQTALTQANANGNTIEYANIMEGYDNPSVGLSEVTQANTVTIETYKKGDIYVYQNGDSTDTISNYDIQIVAFGNFGINSNFNVTTTSGTLNYVSSSDETASTLLTNFAALAASNGYTTSIVGNILTINKANQVLINWLFIPVDDTAIADFKSSMPVYDWWTRYSFGIVFFDKKGKTNGVVYPTNNSLQTDGYSVANLIGSDYLAQMNYIATEVKLTTPDWAYSYQIVRSNRLNKGYFVQWISDLTIKEISGGTLNQSYAYIGINSLDGFIAENPASNFLAYSFVAKDRIRFIANGMQTNGSATNIYTDKDFEILDYVANPTINGIKYTGKYIKIILPTTSGSFDFGTAAFYNYFLEVYRPVVPASNSLNLYYEFGLQRLCTPNTAIDNGLISFEGDCYGRFRDINTVPNLKWTVENLVLDGGGVAYDRTLLLNLITPLFTPTGLEASSQLQDSAISSLPNPVPDTKIIKITDGLSKTFKIKGYVSIKSTGGTLTTSFYVYYSDGTTKVSTTLISGMFDNNNYTFDVTLTVPSGTTSIFIGYNPNVFDPTIRTIQSVTLSIIEQNKSLRQFCIDPNFSDYYQSAVNSNGREFIHDINAKKQSFPTTIRFSEEYQQNTNINKTNRFYPENFDDYDRSNGDIKKLFVEGKRMFVFQQFDIGVVPILQQIVKDTSGNPLQANSDILINKIQYPYQGKIGIGNVPESFAYHDHVKYGVDNNKGIVWRLSQDGITELSVVYDMDAFFAAKLSAYNSSLNNGYAASGQNYLGNPTIYGGFDYYTNKYILALEEINRYNSGGTLTFHQDPYTLVFAESRDTTEGFECFASYHPEKIQNLGTLLCTFKNGKIWLHDNDTNYCNYYGTQYNASIKLIFGANIFAKKQFVAIAQLGSEAWEIPSIETNINQSSELIPQDFQKYEGIYHCSFLRDKNSIGGLLNGGVLKGEYIVIEFKKTNANSLISLKEVLVKTIESSLNLKP